MRGRRSCLGRSHLGLDGQRQTAAVIGCRLGAPLWGVRHARRPRSPGRRRSTSPASCTTARATAVCVTHVRDLGFAAGISVVDPALHARPRLRTARRRPHGRCPRGGLLRPCQARRRRASRRCRRGRQAPSTGPRPAGRGDTERPRTRTRQPHRIDRARNAQLHALTQIVCHLLARHYRELIAYGAGWTDPERQQPVGDTGSYVRSSDRRDCRRQAQAALDDPDPIRGIAQLTARLGTAFVLDPAGVTRTKALGAERMAGKLRDALPGGGDALRTAVWEFMQPMLSRAVVGLNRDAFVIEGDAETTIDHDAHRAGRASSNSRSTRQRAPKRLVASASGSPRPFAQPPGLSGRTSGWGVPSSSFVHCFFASESIQHVW